MRIRLTIAIALALLLTSCGGRDEQVSVTPNADGTTTTQETASTVTTTTVAVDREGGAEFTGTFETGPGIGPGVIVFLLDDTGDKIVEVEITPDLRQFECPNGQIVNAGGRMYGAIWDVAIDNVGSFVGSSFFDFDISGVFDSATEAHGTLDLQLRYDCDYVLVLDWTATSQ